MSKNIIKETLAFKELTEEEKKARGILGRLYGPCADFINPTRNGRKYPEELWEKVFNENELIKEAFANGGIPGELDHPTDREEVDTSKLAIIMPEPPVKGDDGKLIAYFDILDTPNGRIAYALAKYGYKLGISSRGSGDVDEYTDQVIPESYDFKCFDLVLTPSVKDARLTMTESLDTNRAKLNKALCESLESANPDEKKVMEETLDRLNIKLNESEVTEDEIKVTEEPQVDEVAEVEETTEVTEPTKEEVAEPTELSFDDKIKEFLGLVYDGENAPTDEETEAFIAAFKSIFPEECFNPEGCTDKQESASEETVNETEEANDEGSDELIKSLQDALTQKSNYEGQVKSLQEQIAVSDTEVNSLKEENSRLKESMVTLSEKAHDTRELEEKVASLQEELKIKDSKLQQLVENKAKDISDKVSLNESLSNKDKEITKLNSEKSESESQIKQLNEKLESSQKQVQKSNKLVEQYKEFAYQAANRYIESKAVMLGVDVKDIKSRLPRDGYSMKDVDRICESLQDGFKSVNKLPFNLNNGKVKKVVMTESKNDNLRVPLNDGDEVDDSLLELAGIRK